MKGGSNMDFFTGMAFWSIILLVIINAILVKRTDVVIHQEREGAEEKKAQNGTTRCAG